MVAALLEKVSYYSISNLFVFPITAVISCAVNPRKLHRLILFVICFQLSHVVIETIQINSDARNQK